MFSEYFDQRVADADMRMLFEAPSDAELLGVTNADNPDTPAGVQNTTGNTDEAKPSPADTEVPEEETPEEEEPEVDVRGVIKQFVAFKPSDEEEYYNVDGKKDIIDCFNKMMNTDDKFAREFLEKMFDGIKHVAIGYGLYDEEDSDENINAEPEEKSEESESNPKDEISDKEVKSDQEEIERHVNRFLY